MVSLDFSMLTDGSFSSSEANSNDSSYAHWNQNFENPGEFYFEGKKTFSVFITEGVYSDSVSVSSILYILNPRPILS